MGLSDFHHLRNTLIEAMKIERDEIPAVQKSIDFITQSKEELESALDTAESNLSEWESKEPWSTEKVKAGLFFKKKHDDNYKLWEKKLGRMSTTTHAHLMVWIIGTITLFPLVAVMVSVLLDEGSLIGAIAVVLLSIFSGFGYLWGAFLWYGCLGVLLAFLSPLFPAGNRMGTDVTDHWPPYLLYDRENIDDQKKAAASRMKQEKNDAKAIEKAIKENSDEYFSKKRSNEKSTVRGLKEKIDACQKDIVANQSKLDNLRHKKEGLIESVSHLIPYSENLS